MKKQELIHLHGLLAEVSADVEAHCDSDLDLSGYDDLGVRPTSIHKSKTDHKTAVFALARSITDELDEDVEERVPAAAD